MLKFGFCGLLLVSAIGVHAEDSCGLKATKLLAEGKVEELSALFVDGQDVAPAVKTLTASVGKLSGIREVASPRAGESRRLSVQTRVAGALDKHKYWGAWFNVDSELLGASQVHVARAIGPECSLVGLYVDTPR